MSTCPVKFHPDGDNCQQNNGQEINAVMFRPNSNLRVTLWIIKTGRVNSGGLSIKHAAAFDSTLFQSMEGLFYLYFVFKILSFSKSRNIDCYESHGCFYRVKGISQPAMTPVRLPAKQVCEINRNNLTRIFKQSIFLLYTEQYVFYTPK